MRVSVAAIPNLARIAFWDALQTTWPTCALLQESHMSVATATSPLGQTC